MIAPLVEADIPDLRDLVGSIFSNPDQRPIWEWASDNVWMPVPLFPPEFEGRFSVRKGVGRIGVEILRALQDPAIRQVDLLKPPRGSGSLWADLWMLWMIDRDPGDMLCNFATDQQAWEFSKTRIQKFIRTCSRVARLKAEDRFDSSNNLILLSNGMNLYIQGSTPSNLQAKPARYARNEELWDWPAGRYQEMAARLQDYAKLGLHKIFNQSQGGLEGGDLDIQWRLGSQSNLQIPCVKCCQFFPLEIRSERPDGTYWGLNWNENEQTKTQDGDWRIEEVRKDFWYECPHCKFQDRRSDAEAHEHWLNSFKFVSENPGHDPAHVSFRYTDMICNLRWSICQDLLSSYNANNHGNIDPYKAFIQKKAARAWSNDHISRLQKFQRYVFGSALPDEAGHILTVDRHGDGSNWAVVWLWSKNGHSRTIWYGMLNTHQEIESKRIEYKIPPPLVGIDYGFCRDETLKLCAKYGWTGFWGSDSDYFTSEKVIMVGQQMRKEYTRLIYKDDRQSILKSVQAGKDPILVKANAFRVSKPTTTNMLYRHLRSAFHAEPPVCPNESCEKLYQRHMRAWRFDKDRNKVVCADSEDHFWDASRMQFPLAHMKRWLIADDSVAN